MQRVEGRINFNHIEGTLFCFVASLKPIYCFALITKGQMNYSIAVSIVSSTLALVKISQLAQELRCSLAFALQCISLCQAHQSEVGSAELMRFLDLIGFLILLNRSRGIAIQPQRLSKQEADEWKVR